MRKMLAAGIAVLGLALMACQPTEPAMTITASTYKTPVCQDIEGVTGTVSPPKATTRVVLQRSVSGEWRDWSGPSRAGGASALLADDVDSSGNYRINYMVPRTTSTMKLRVRSNGGGSTSPTFYVTPWTPTSGRCG